MWTHTEVTDRDVGGLIMTQKPPDACPSCCLSRLTKERQLQTNMGNESLNATEMSEPGYLGGTAEVN